MLSQKYIKLLHKQHNLYSYEKYALNENINSTEYMFRLPSLAQC